MENFSLREDKKKCVVFSITQDTICEIQGSRMCTHISLKL